MKALNILNKMPVDKVFASEQEAPKLQRSRYPRPGLRM